MHILQKPSCMVPIGSFPLLMRVISFVSDKDYSLSVASQFSFETPERSLRRKENRLAVEFDPTLRRWLFLEAPVSLPVVPLC